MRCFRRRLAAPTASPVMRRIRRRLSRPAWAPRTPGHPPSDPRTRALQQQVRASPNPPAVPPRTIRWPRNARRAQKKKIVCAPDRPAAGQLAGVTDGNAPDTGPRLRVNSRAQKPGSGGARIAKHQLRGRGASAPSASRLAPDRHVQPVRAGGAARVLGRSGFRPRRHFGASVGSTEAAFMGSPLPPGHPGCRRACLVPPVATAT